eukprot:gene8603-17753_t
MITENSKDVVLDIVQECDKFVNAHLELREIISKAFFQMTMARQYDRSALSIFHCRHEIDATRKLFILNDGTFKMETATNDEDPLLYLTGMPTRNSRSAQHLFVEALIKCLKLAEHGHCILKGLSLGKNEEIEEGSS